MSAAGDGASGIQGDVSLGPLQLVQRVGETNSQPLANAPIVIHPCTASHPVPPGPDYCTDVGAQIVARAKSDNDGKFSVAVAPGRYVVYGEKIAGGAFPRPPQSNDVIVVTAGACVKVTLPYDTGIR
jgi:hypothetical protein